MPVQNEPRDTSIPNDPSSKEKADGSRNNESVEGGGVTNRPIEEEQREQQNLPPRGDRKDGSDA